MFRAWSDDYLIGIADIDAQHRGFFKAVEQLFDGILNCQGQYAVEQAIAFLRDYANRHFQSEEALMARHGFPQLEEHSQLHVDFLDNLELLDDDLKVFGPTRHLAERVFELAQTWLVEHITREDMRFAAYINHRRLSDHG